MTTIAANLREIAADSRVSMEGINDDTYTSIKLFAGNGVIYAVTGEDCAGSTLAVEWLQRGAPADWRPEVQGNWVIIELSRDGLAFYNTSLERERVLDSVIAAGSGRKLAYYCMKHLHMSPAEAVAEACRTDTWSAPPIYVASLKDCRITRWTPRKPKKARR